MRIAFRVDASPQIGLGHLMRCLTLAKVALATGAEVWFFSRELLKVEQLTNSGVQLVWLKTHQASELNSVLDELEIETLIIDHYQVDESFFLQLRKLGRILVYLDDLNAFTYPVELVVNGNLGAERLPYQRSPFTKELLLGIKYNLIRDEFRDLPSKQVRPAIKKILITTGGSDYAGLSARLVRALQQPALAKVELHLLVGAGFQNQTLLTELAQNLPNLYLHQQVTRVSELMQTADLAIAAGGSSLYELAACGVYTLAFIYAANQTRLVEQLSKLGLVFNLGWYENLPEEQLGSLIQQADYSTRRQVAQLGQRLVDAEGAARVYQKILELKKS